MSGRGGFSRNGKEMARWSEREENTLKAMYLNGFPWNDIAEAIGRNKAACMQKLNQCAGIWGIRRRPRRSQKPRA